MIDFTIETTSRDKSRGLLFFYIFLLFFGFGVWRGIKWGTLICALVNGFAISLFTRLLERRFEFRDKFSGKNK